MANQIKLLLVSIALLAIANHGIAQSNADNAQSGIPIEMRFPQGKSKAVILSYDDGFQADRKMVKLMNDYHLIGTFHINSNKLGTKDYLTKEEIKSLFQGHEVSVHSANHPNLVALSKIDVIYEIVGCRKELESLCGYPVRGMAYPFGGVNDFVVDAMKGLGIEYSRTVNDTYSFGIPNDFLLWHPTMHQFGRTSYDPNVKELDPKEVDHFFQVVDQFMKTDALALLDVWGHSWENDRTKTGWAEMERFFKLIAKNPTIHYTTQIALVDYINAYRNLKFSVDKTMVTNLSATDVFIQKKNKTYKIAAGTTQNLPE